MSSAELEAGFGEGEGELLTLQYPKPLPMRLDRWLVSQRPEQSRARIQKFIDAGYVRVNGITGRAKTPLRQDDEIQLWMPPPEPLPYLKPEPMELDVLFEDEHLIVINKPAGLTVHPAPGNKVTAPGVSRKYEPGAEEVLAKGARKGRRRCRRRAGPLWISMQYSELPRDPVRVRRLRLVVPVRTGGVACR